MPKENNYNPKEVEAKWQKKWEQDRMGSAADFAVAEKNYLLVEFPYPSGEGLHVGHPRSYTAMDVVARKRRAEGKNVLYPIGFDAFGLPSENYAIKTGIHPSQTTKKNIATFTKQLKSLGLSFDWSREVSTTDPAYYKWTQWIFLQLYKRGLAYKAKININWCESCKIGLANEEVVGGVCERCGGKVVKKEKSQWIIKITEYADRLISDLDNVDYLPKIKTQQVNWIGRKEWIDIDYAVANTDLTLTVSTTRPDTNFGATFIVLAPEHPLLPRIFKYVSSQKQAELKKYINQAKSKSELERIAEGRAKTGVDTGLWVVNRLNNAKLPILVADFVLSTVGTGAVVGVPGHDLRDFQFAKAMKLPIKRVVVGADGDKSEIKQEGQVQEEDGVMINSGFLNGVPIKQAIGKMMDFLEKKGWGRRTVRYNLRDWVFSRQHYWGEPIPMVYCEECAKRRPRVLLVHGIGGQGGQGWFASAKRELEKKGYEVLAPDLPNTMTPKPQEWQEALLKQDIKQGDKVIIIAHSLGGPAALQYIEQARIEIAKLILVAPAGQSIDFANLAKQGFAEEQLSSIKEFVSVKLDLNKIKQYCPNIELFYSNDDPYIPQQIIAELRPLVFKNNLFDRLGHFSQESGKELYLEIMERVPKASELNPGWQPLPASELPLTLPEVKKYQPTDTGESPLSSIRKFVETTCPICGSSARRETDTMPNWAGSNWYFLRYADPHNNRELADKKKLTYWLPVDWYNGGMEHTTLHLLYSRFVYKFLWDIGAVPENCGSEPYRKRTSHGMILGEGGEKMSKSRGNVVNPDDMVKEYGADALRVYEMFMGPFDQAIPWSTEGLIGVRRFLDRVWKFSGSVKEDVAIDDRLERKLHQTIKKVSEDIETMGYNTAVSALMIMLNEMEAQSVVATSVYCQFLQLLWPFAPHLASELYFNLTGTDIARAPWPQFAKTKIAEKEVEIIFQVNGKVRGKITMPVGASEEEAKKAAEKNANVKKHLAGKKTIKVIYVPNRLINFVVR